MGNSRKQCIKLYMSFKIDYVYLFGTYHILKATKAQSSTDSPELSSVHINETKI